MSQLVPCAACSRHVRVSETACPFCAAPFSAPASRPADASSRLGRAALFAFQATTVAAALNACGPSSAPPTTVEPPPQTAIAQPYGAPPQPPPPTTVTPPVTEVPPPSTTVPATEVPPEAHSEDDHGPRMHVLYGAAPAPEDDHGRTLQAAYGGAPPRGPDGL